MIFEYLPLIAFGISYYFYDLITATIVLVVLSLLIVPIVWKKTGKAPYIHIFTAIILGVFGGLTIFSGNPDFIKMKPTIASFIFAIVLLSPFAVLKKLMGSAIVMADKNWKKLSNRAGGYFLICAVLNEIVWRNFTETHWVQFKIFGLTGLYALFIIVNIPFFKNNIKFK